MACYYFHLCDGQDTLLDSEGREIGDPALLRGLVLKDARAIIAQDAIAGHIQLGQSIQVQDESGAVVHELHFRDAVTIEGVSA